jgi:GntR family transcriptional regulator/MocR family aminotransferase
MDIAITLDSQSDTPLHRQLYEEIRRAILSGRLAPRTRVPSTRSLAESLGISRATVTSSYDYLLSEGYLEAVTGSGTYVCKTLPDELLRTQRRTPDRGIEPERQPARKPLRVRLSRLGASLYEKDWLDYGGAEPEIQFSFGRPDLEHFPMRIWLQLFNQRAKQLQLSELDCPSQSCGYAPLREAVARYLGRARAVQCKMDQVIIVSGSQQALNLVARLLVDRGDAVAVENPCYIGAKKILEVQGANLTPVRVDNSGMVVSEIPPVPNLKLVYVTPSHQFPTGVVLSLPRRLELISWAKKYSAYIVEDDYDSEYRYVGRPVPALAGLDNDQTVIYMGTFSKVLFPALRLGYLVVPEHLLDVFARGKWLVDRHSPLLDQQVLTDFINQGHLDRHIRRMRTRYQHRRGLVMDELRKAFCDRVSILGENAGINVLVRIKSHLPDQRLVEDCRVAGVGIASTQAFYVGDSPRGEFLINYGGVSDEQLCEGIRRLAAVAGS